MGLRSAAHPANVLDGIQRNTHRISWICGLTHKMAAIETINWPPLANCFRFLRLQAPQMNRRNSYSGQKTH